MLYTKVSEEKYHFLYSFNPERFKLYQNYPVIFSGKTKIGFDIPEESKIKLAIYDVYGRQLKILINRILKAGSYEVEWDAENLPSNMYIYKLMSGDFVDAKKMFLHRTDSD